MPSGCVMKIPNVQSILVGGTSAKCNFQKSDGSFETSEVSALYIIRLHMFYSCQCNKYVIFMFDRIEIVSKIGIIQMNWNTCQFTMLVLKIQNAVRISEIQKTMTSQWGKTAVSSRDWLFSVSWETKFEHHVRHSITYNWLGNLVDMLWYV